MSLRLAVFVWFASVAGAARADSGVPLNVTLIDGKQMTCAATSLGRQIVLDCDGREVLLSTDDLLELMPVEAPVASTTTRAWTFELASGSTVGGDIESGTPNEVALRGSTGQLMRVAAAGIRRAVSMRAPVALRERVPAALPDNETNDFVLVAKNKRSMELWGHITEFSSTGLRFRVGDRDVPIPWSRLVGFCRPSERARTAPALVLTSSGDRFVGALEGGGSDGVLIDTPSMGTISIAWSRVVRVEFRGRRAIFLSDAVPVDVQIEPLIDRTWPLGLNRSLLGGPIVLGGRRYAKGLVLHSRVTVSYRVGRHAKTFVASVGISDEMKNRGDALARVLCDGEVRWEAPRVRGGQPPIEVSIDLTGVDILELEVGFGENLDLSDHVVWANARVLE